MDTSKIIKGGVNSGRYTVTAPIVKEDYGLYLKIEGLELPSTYEVDFSNSEHNGTSVTMIGNSDGVLIPHQFIDTGKDVFAFLYHVGANYGRTVYKFRIPNKVRPDRTDDTPTPEQASVIDQAISALNSAVEQTAQDVIDADASAQEAAESARASGESALSASNSALSSGEYASNALSYAESASASASASAQSASQSAQIKADVEDMVDDAQGYAQASAQSASASANSAIQASLSESEAERAKGNAQTYASQAQTSANTASAKAQDASTSAQTATQKATEASQSASQAQTYKTDAESAKTASQTAQGLAESARDSARGYAEDAQGYAEDAQASAESISASASQIAQNTADILKAFPTDTASGSIASFTDGADDLPLKSLVVNIDPVQSGSGDPSPDNVRPISGWSEVNVQRTGVNLFPYKDIESQTKNGVTITVEKSNGAITNIHMQGTATTDFPIPFYINGEDDQWVLPKGDCKLYIGGDKPTQSRIFDINIRKAGETSDISATSTVRTITLSEQTAFKSAYIWIYSGAVLNHNIIPVIVQSGVDTSVKYPVTQRQSITIDLEQTVYGGHLDVLSGVLTVDRAMVDLGTLTWNYVASWACNFRASELIGAKPPATAVVTPNAICSILPVLDYTTVSTPVDGITIIFATSVQAGKVWAHSGTYTDATAFKAAMTGQTLVYELATPIEIQLTPQQVNSLLGVNNIWADSGDTEVEYRANTKLYINKKIAEAISALS